MAEPADIILPLLRDMRAENASLHRDTRALVGVLDSRLGKIGETLVSYRQALTADTLPSKLLTGEFEERIEAPGKKVRDLETMK